MKYVPKPNCALIQLIDEPVKEQQSKILIIPNSQPTKYFAKVIAIGSEIPFVDVDMVILYDKYHSECVDEENKIYSITLDGVICAVLEQ